jgi:hypothetical protein
MEAIMQVFNLTSSEGAREHGGPSVHTTGGGGGGGGMYNGSSTAQQHTFRFPASSSEASVEINCIILGAKLVVTEASQ